MKRTIVAVLAAAVGVLAVAGAVLVAADSSAAGSSPPADKAALTRKLWPAERIAAAMAAVRRQKAEGLLSEASCAKRMAMLRQRQAGTFDPEALSVTNPPLNFVQNAGFEKVNRNSGKKRSRWLWWSGWDWGGDYENSWESRPEYVHSGKFSARIRCTGAKGRIGIFTPSLPAVPGAEGYKLTFWARGEGDNLLFVNFEGGARGQLRRKIPPEWTEITVTGQPVTGKNTYQVYFYHIGTGTIWLDDVKLVPVGGTLK